MTPIVLFGNKIKCVPEEYYKGHQQKDKLQCAEEAWMSAGKYRDS